MWRKIMMLAVLLVAGLQAHAQFEKETWYLNTSLTGLDLSHSKYEGTSFGIALGGGAFVADNVAVLLQFRGHYLEKGADETSFGAGARYYFSNCGVYGGLGMFYKHLSNGEWKKNLTCITPEVGYAFFLNGTITVEPAVYYDISLDHCADYSKLGFKIGFGFYF